MRARTVLPVAGLSLAVLGGVLSAHTAGIVVAPSHAGQDAVAISATSTTLPSTTVATPTDLVVLAPGQSDGEPVLGATLMSLGNALAGETVGFYLGTATTGAVLCAATTGSDGTATCDAGASQAPAIADQGYSAAFEGGQGLAASTSTWPGTTPTTLTSTSSSIPSTTTTTTGLLTTPAGTTTTTTSSPGERGTSAPITGTGSGVSSTTTTGILATTTAPAGTTTTGSATTTTSSTSTTAGTATTTLTTTPQN